MVSNGLSLRVLFLTGLIFGSIRLFHLRYFLSNFGDKETTLEDVLDKLEKIDKELDELRESKNE